MPYIQIATNIALTDVQKESIKTETGKLIVRIPGKSEASLMVHFADSQCIYFRGDSRDCIFVEVRSYKAIEPGAKQAFVEAYFDMLEQQTGISKDEMFLNIFELNQWGKAGTYS